MEIKELVEKVRSEWEEIFIQEAFIDDFERVLVLSRSEYL